MSFIGASVGARLGPGWFARLFGSHRAVLVVPVLVGYSVLGAALLVGWVAFIAMAIPLASLAFGLAGWSSIGLVAEGIARMAWWRHDDSGPVLAESPSGLPATAWLRSRSALLRPIVLVVTLPVLVAGEVVAAVVGGYGWGFVAPVVLLVFWLWVGWPILLGRVRAGGLYLTADGVEHLYGSDRSSVRWADVVLTTDPLGLIGRAGPSDVSYQGIVRDRGGWRMYDRPDRMARRVDVPLPTAYLTGREAVIAEAIEGIRDDREGSPTPGTIGSVGTIRELAALRRVTFRPSTD